MTNEKKMTKAEMFSLIADLLADNEDVVAFCEHEKELLAKKRASGSKPTKTQIENEGIKATILENLANSEVAMTIGELCATNGLDGLTNQRVSALVTQLKNDGKVIRTEVKGKAFFKLA